MTTQEEKDFILSVQVKNHTGVLQRISGLFSRRCYNIKSIVAAQTVTPELTEILIVVTGDDRVVSQVKKQVEKLVDVVRVTVLDQQTCIAREHMLIAVNRTMETRNRLLGIAQVFHAEVLYVKEDTVLFEVVGTPATLDSFVRLFAPEEVKKILRTGTMAIELD